MIPKVGNSSDIYAVDALVTALEKNNKRKKNLDFEITDVKQVEGMAGIGAGTQKRIKEILVYGVKCSKH